MAGGITYHNRLQCVQLYACKKTAAHSKFHPALGELESSWMDENKNPSAPPTTVMTLPPPSGTASQVVSVWASPVRAVRNCSCSCTTLARLSLPAGAQLHHHHNHHLPDSHKLTWTFYKAVLCQNGKQSTDPKGHKTWSFTWYVLWQSAGSQACVICAWIFPGTGHSSPPKRKKKEEKRWIHSLIFALFFFFTI